MNRSEQLPALNEFEGRPQPSERLIKRASAFQSAHESAMTHPVFIWGVARNLLDYNRADLAESVPKRRFIEAGIVFRTAACLVLTAPANAEEAVTRIRFESQLRREYPSAFTVPPPYPTWSRWPVLGQPAEFLAAALLAHEAGAVASADMPLMSKDS